MINIKNINEEDVDILELHGQLDDDGLEQLRQVITLLRQQNSTKLLILGSQIESIPSRQLSALEIAIRTYRSLGGRIAFVGFSDSQINQIRKTTWSRHLNIFDDVEIAKQFLSPIVRKKRVLKKLNARKNWENNKNQNQSKEEVETPLAEQDESHQTHNDSDPDQMEKEN